MLSLNLIDCNLLLVLSFEFQNYPYLGLDYMIDLYLV